MADEKTLEIEELEKKLAAAEKKAKAAEKKAAEAQAKIDEAEADRLEKIEAAQNEAAKNEGSVKAILDKQEKKLLHLFKDDGKYSSDLVVGINGMMYQIQRGVDVEVPESVYEAVMNSMKQDEIASMKIAELAKSASDPALM